MKGNSNKDNRITVVAPLRTEKASLDVVAKALNLPLAEDRQPDLQYMTAIFVSSGMNKNGAVFLGSELCKAKKSIPYKAVDIEHVETSIIGQIMDCVYMTRDGAVQDPDGLIKSKATNSLDMMDMDIAVSCIIHKARFPQIASEIMNGEWMVSMEAYYRDYDVKVGDLIIPRDQASKMGYDKLVGSVVRLKDGDKEMGYHLVGRVLRDITFSGVGIVKNPANERSIIMEAAAVKDFVESHKEHASVIDLAGFTVQTPSLDFTQPPLNLDISNLIQAAVKEGIEKAGLRYVDMRPGTCLHYKKEVTEQASPVLVDPSTDLSQYPLFSPAGGVDSNNPGTIITKEHHCSLFDIGCSSRPGDATAPDCWRNVFASTVKEELDTHEEIVRSLRNSSADLVKLQALIDEAKKFRN